MPLMLNITAFTLKKGVHGFWTIGNNLKQNTIFNPNFTGDLHVANTVTTLPEH